MSLQITTAFVEQYRANVMMLAQQKGSRLRNAVRVEPIIGKNAFFDRLGAVTAQVRTSRHADTPQIDTPHSRRRLSLADYDWADLIDDLDKVRMLNDPTSDYALAGAWAMGRVMDDVIITALNGTASTGVAGAGSQSLGSDQQIGVSSSGLTISKLLQTKEKFDAADVDNDTPRWIAVSARQIRDLLNTTEVKSADFNTVKALAQGELNAFMGFTFIQTERLAVDGSSDRLVLAWLQDGLILGMGKEPIARISERDDKNYSVQVYYSQALGAVRMEEVKVVEIACSES